MKSISKSQPGYVLVSVTALLLVILAAVMAINNSYSTKIITDRETDALGRDEIELSALAHLQAYAEQKSCTATPDNISVSGDKDGTAYTLSWNKSPTGTTLTGSYEPPTGSTANWTTEQSNIELYGETQTATWVLAPYFSEFVEIKHNDKNRHHDHSNHDDAKVKLNADMVLRSFKLGPLLTEPLTIVQAELELFFNNIDKFNNPQLLQLNAIRFPWDSADVTDDNTGLGANSSWTKGSYDKFEPIDTKLTMLTDSAKIDFTELMGSWVSGARPSNGWALTTTSSSNTEWITNPGGTTFEKRQRMHIKYRCACGEACVGVDQTEVAALATLTDVGGYGGGAAYMVKLWLHRAHQEYLLENPSSAEQLGRTVYYPAGLSDFDVPNIGSGQEITGAHIEPADADHPDHHYYTILDGKSITNLPSTTSSSSSSSLFARLMGSSSSSTTTTTLANSNDKQLIYFQSPANKAVGDSLTPRRMPTPTSGFQATTQPVIGYVPNTSSYVGGFSYYDQRYWFGTRLASETKTQDFPVEDDTTTATVVHKADITRSSLDLAKLNFNNNRTIDALHVIDKNNILLSSEYFDVTSNWESELGRRQFHDGDIVLYNNITKTTRLIDGEISRSNGNNVSAISLFKEPMPPSGSSEAVFAATFPFLY